MKNLNIQLQKALLLLMLFFIVFTAYSQDERDSISTHTVKEIIIQGNRLETPFSEAARDIQIITQKEIAALPVQTLTELLVYVSGVDMRQRAPFGTQGDISIDGGSFEQTLVLLNGIKLINAQTAHNVLNLPISLDAIDHIEVLRGAAARVYGINALTGAVNIVTKKSNESFVTANIYGGTSFKRKETGDGDGMYGGGGVDLVGNFANNNHRQLLGLSQNLFNGYRYNSAHKNTKIFYDGDFYINEKNSISTFAGHTYNKFGANGFYAAPGDKNSEEIVETSIFSLSSKHQLGKVNLMPRISDRYDEDDYRYFKSDLSRGRSKHFTNALMLELNGNLTTSAGVIGMGWESRLTKINSSNIGEHKMDNHGAFIEFRTKLFKRLVTNVGIYVNYNSQFDWKAYPGLDLAYRLNNKWKIAASFGSGQRIPSFTDLYLKQPPANVGNPDVQPETAWQYDANIEFTSGHLKVNVGSFYRKVTDFIDWVRPNMTTPYSPSNFGNIIVQGIYSRINQQLILSGKHQLNFCISYNFLNPEHYDYKNEQSKYVLESLRHQLIAGVNYRYGSFNVQIENRYIKRELNDAYNIVDGRISYEIHSVLFYANVSNMFDAKYKEAGAVPMPGKWFALGLKYNWKKK